MTPPAIRTLFIAKMPYPPVGGEHLRNWQNINILSQLGPVHVFAIFRNDYDTQGIGAVTSWQRYNVNRQPFPWRRIALFSLWLRKLGLWDHWAYRREAARQIDEQLQQLKPDLIVIEELWLYHYYRSVARHHSCPVIFDHHNVEALLFEQTKCKGQGLRGWLRQKIHLPQVRADERAFMQQATQTWVCSEHDKSLLAELYGKSPKRFVIPNTINLTDYAAISALEETPASPTLLYLGNFDYIPNADAAQELIEQIYPHLCQTYPRCQLLLVGRSPTPFMLKAAAQNPDITVTGQVPDINPYLAASSVMVVPLRKGSGTRFKILEAFAARRPVVSTAKGAEGLAVKDGQHLLIREQAEDLAAGVVQLWQNAEHAHQMTAAAHHLVQSKYAWGAAGRQVHQALQELFPFLSADVDDTELPFFSIVIPTYARHQQLGECLAAIAQLNYPRDRFEVIIVNDGDPTLPEAITAPYPEMLSLQCFYQPNSGPATARNTGAEHAKGEFLAFTDDDCQPDPNWLMALAHQFVKAPDKPVQFAVGGEVVNALPNNLYAAASQLHGDAVYAYFNASEREPSFLASCNFSLPRSLYQRLGGFNTRFPLAAAEDREFCDRWLRNGYAMHYVPAARIYHAHHLSFKRFLQQHFNYGRGAFHFHHSRAQAAIAPVKTDLKFYWHLLTYPFRTAPFLKAAILSLLFVGCNLAKTAGFFWESMLAAQRPPNLRPKARG